MRNKITKEQIKEMKKLKSEGKKDSEIAILFGIAQSSARYHLVSGEKEKKIEYQKNWRNSLTKKQRIKIYNKNKEYVSNYFKNRYKNDPIFREKHKERVMRNKKNSKSSSNSLQGEVTSERTKL